MGVLVIFLGVQIGEYLEFLGVFLGKSEVFKMSGIFKGYSRCRLIRFPFRCHANTFTSCN